MSAQDIPETLPLEFQDAVTQIFADRGTTGNLTFVLDFEVSLNVDILRRAVRLLLDAEPILGCFLDRSAKEPVWRRRDDLDVDPGFLVVKGDVPENATDPVLTEQWRIETARNLETVLRQRPPGDRLYLKVSHVIADGTGMVDVAARLAQIYSGLLKDPDFRLPPNTAPRDSFAWLKEFKLRQKLRIITRDLGEIRHLTAKRAGLSLCDPQQLQRPTRDSRQVSLVVGPERLEEIDALARDRGSTRNDMLLAGFARSYARFADADQSCLLQIAIPNNLRRFAEVQSRPAINNLAGVANLFVRPNLGSDFGETLDRVSSDMQRLRGAFMGAGNPMFMWMLNIMSFDRKGRAIDSMLGKAVGKAVPPVLTSIGRVRERRLKFGDVTPGAIQLAPFPLRSPLVVVANLEYRGSLIFSSGFAGEDYTEDSMNRLLSDITDEIAV